MGRVEMHGSLRRTVIERHVKGTTHGHHHLSTFVVRVRSALLTLGDIVNPEHPLDGKGDTTPPLRYRQAASFVPMLGQTNQSAATRQAVLLGIVCICVHIAHVNYISFHNAEASVFVPREEYFHKDMKKFQEFFAKSKKVSTFAPAKRKQLVP